MQGADAQRQNGVGDPGHQQVERINKHRPPREVVFAHPPGGERHQRQAEQQEKIGPQDAAAHPAGGMQHMVVIVPVDADIHKTQNVAEEYRSQFPKVRQLRAVRNLQFEHHDGDDDGNNTIAERLKPPLAHECSLA